MSWIGLNPIVEAWVMQNCKKKIDFPRQLTPKLIFSITFDNLIRNYILILNLSLFQWLLLYLKGYRPLKFGQNRFWSISLAKLDNFFCLQIWIWIHLVLAKLEQLFVCIFGYMFADLDLDTSRYLYIIYHSLITMGIRVNLIAFIMANPGVFT